MKQLHIAKLLTGILVTAQRNKKYWLLPLVMLLLVMGALLVIGSMAGPAAPFIYAIF